MKGRHPIANARGPLLIVDDNADDAKLGKRAVELLNPQIPAQVLSSGSELVAHLRRIAAESKSGELFVPCAILLDLRMPDMDGFAVMEWLSHEPQFSNIPVIVLSVLDDLPTLKRAYSLGARAYLLKPISADALRNTLSSLSISV